MSHSEPPYTKVSNEILDDVLPYLRGGEVQVLLVIIRETAGYHRAAWAITYDDFEEKCGLSRPAIARAIKGLRQRGVIDCEGNTYSIVYGHSNDSLLCSNDSLLDRESDSNETLPETVTNVNCDSNETLPETVTNRYQNTGVLKKEKKDLKKEKESEIFLTATTNSNGHTPPVTEPLYLQPDDERYKKLHDAWEIAVQESRDQLARGAPDWLQHTSFASILEDAPGYVYNVLVEDSTAMDAIRGRMGHLLGRTISSVIGKPARVEFEEGWV